MELVEVLDNPPLKGGADVSSQIRLTKGQLNQLAGIKPQRKKRKGGKKVGKKAGKKKPRRRKDKSVDGMQVGVGAVTAAALEMLVIRNKDVNTRIPPQVRRYSGAILAAVGWMMATAKKAKKGQRSFGYGLFSAGLAFATKDEIAVRQADKLTGEMDKFATELAEAVKSVTTEGLGYAHRYPGVPRMSAPQAAAALGMQSRVPFHPYGLGVFDYSPNPGMGTLVDASHAPMDPTNDPRLDPGGLGLGELTDSGEAGAWLDGQFAFSDSDYRDSW
ncbi:MAG: hypothetical protein ACYSUI_05590 [Planctomycetota bacterium]|jgi:hypothetical protein